MRWHVRGTHDGAHDGGVVTVGGADDKSSRIVLVLAKLVSRRCKSGSKSRRWRWRILEF